MSPLIRRITANHNQTVMLPLPVWIATDNQHSRVTGNHNQTVRIAGSGKA